MVYTVNHLEHLNYSNPMSYTVNHLEHLNYSNPMVYTVNHLEHLNYSNPLCTNSKPFRTPQLYSNPSGI